MATQKLEIELWDKSKRRIADVTNLAKNRSIELVLNGVDTIQFSMNLDAFEEYARKVGTHPRNLLYPLQVDIITKLDGQYWRGFECVAVTPYLNISDSTLSVRGSGFLSLLNKRYLTGAYSSTEATDLAWQLIAATQSKPNGDFGITRGSQQYLTGVSRVRNFENRRVRDELTSLTRLETGQYDMNFTHDKKFETYRYMGAVRNTPLWYGEGGNIKGVFAPTEGGSVSNEITGLGSGFGPDQIRSVQNDVESQIAYGIREELPQWNSIERLSELDENAKGFLAQVKDMLRIPAVTVTSETLNLLEITMGDRFQVDLTKHAYTDDVKGLFRLQRLSANFDDNDLADITLTFDDTGVDQNES